MESRLKSHLRPINIGKKKDVLTNSSCRRSFRKYPVQAETKNPTGDNNWCRTPTQTLPLVPTSSLPWNRKQYLNTLRPRQNGRHFADDPFKRIFLNETLRISIKISPNFVPKGPINNIPALVQIMAWRRPGDKPLSEPMMVSLLTPICVTRPQWVNPLDKMVACSKTTFSHAFWWMASFVFWFKFHWNMFLRVQLMISQCWFR